MTETLALQKIVTNGFRARITIMTPRYAKYLIRNVKMFQKQRSLVILLNYLDRLR